VTRALRCSTLLLSEPSILGAARKDAGLLPPSGVNPLGPDDGARGVVRARSERSLLVELALDGRPPDFVWLLAPPLTLNPRALTVDLASLRARAADPAARRGATLWVGTDEVQLDGAALWDPTWRVGNTARRTLPQPPTPLAAPLAAVVEHAGAGSVLRAVAELAPLVGLGGGSTPEGDDLLLGLRAAWQLRQAGGEAVPLAALDELLLSAHRRTHPVSACMLGDAAADRYPEALAIVLDALCGRGALEPALVDLRALGASSGSAMEWGVHLGLHGHGGCPRPASSFSSSP